MKQGHHDYNQQYDDSKGDSKDQNKILVDILYASIVDDDVFLDVVQLVTGGGDFVRDDGREVHVSLGVSLARWCDIWYSDDVAAEVSHGLLRPGL